LAFCRHYVRLGNRVFAIARQSTREVDALAEGSPGHFWFGQFDLSGNDGPRKACEEAIRHLGRIDVLINNAALGQDGLLAHMADTDIARLVEVNLTASILLTRFVVRRMMLDGGGVVLNVSSICGDKGYPGLAVYSATKGGLNAFTRSLACELGGSGIVVNAIAPGFFESEMSRVLSSDQLATIQRRTPTSRLTTPEDVIQACDLLISPGSNITGQVLAVDGGASAT
jgi:3-oxoacyl-[acyl-carrier protein] reductase